MNLTSDKNNLTPYQIARMSLRNTSASADNKKETADNGMIGWLKDSFDAGASNTLANQARTLAEYSPFGGDMFFSAAEYLDKIAERNTPTEELTGGNYIASAIGNALGSGAVTSAEMALILAGAGATGLGAGALGAASKLPVVGGVAKGVQALKTNPVGNAILAKTAGGLLDAPAEMGGVIKEMRKREDVTDQEIRDAAAQVGLQNLALQALSGGIEASALGKITNTLSDSAKQGKFAIPKSLGYGALTGGATEGVEEGLQNIISTNAQGMPIDWKQVAEDAQMGAIGGAFLGGLSGGIGAYANKRMQQRMQNAVEAEPVEEDKEEPKQIETAEVKQLPVGATDNVPRKMDNEQFERIMQELYGVQPQHSAKQVNEYNANIRRQQAQQQRKQLSDVQDTASKLLAENDFIQNEQAKAIRQLEQKTGKPVDVEQVIKQPIPQKAINDKKIAGVVEKASQGDTEALQKFNNWSASVRLAMLTKYLNAGESTLSNAIANAQPKNVEQPAMLTPNTQRTFKASDRVKRFIDTNNAFRNTPQTSVVAPQQEQTTTPNQVVAGEIKTPVSENVVSEMTTNFNPTFNLNERQNGIEIKFGEIPDADFRAKMKAAGFKWNTRTRKWYSKQTDKAMQFAESIGYKAEQPVEVKPVEEAKSVQNKVEEVKPVVEEKQPTEKVEATSDIDDTVDTLKQYYQGAVDNDFNNSTAEHKDAVKQTIGVFADVWRNAHNQYLKTPNDEFLDRAKKKLDEIHNYFIKEFAKSEIVVDADRARMLKGLIDSVKDDYYSTKTVKEEKPKAEANTFKDNPEALLNNDRISKLNTSELKMINDMFDKKQSEKGEVKKEETPKPVSEVKENDNGEEIRGKNPRDNTSSTGTRPDTERSNVGRSVQAPQGKGNVSNGTGERGVYGQVEEDLTPAQKKNSKPSEVAGHNFTITDEDEIGKGGAKTKYKDNVEAIKLLKKLEAENRLATPEEQKILAKYVGWGGLATVFNTYGRGAENWQAEQKELQELLTDTEYRAARASTTNAHYTSPAVIKGVWEIVERLGFKNGRVLEPSMGIGNFFGLMPESMRSKSALNGVELDSLTGRIAKQLYQKANIEITGYQDTKYPDGFFDLVISNVPFGDYKIPDSKYDKYKFNIHNYFFAKSVDQVRAGGLICFITSTGTMQSGSDSQRLRELLQNKVDFIGAVRLPNTAFRENAGTDVTTDLIILQKREEGAQAGKYNNDWFNNVDSEVMSKWGNKPLPINEYYVNNPDMLIGTLVEDKLYGGRLGLDGAGLDVGLELLKRVEKFPKNIYKPMTGKRNLNSVESAKATFLAPSNTKANAYVEKDGKAYQNIDGKLVELSDKEQKKVIDYIGLRDVTKKILAAQIESKTTDAELDTMRAELNKTYDSFVKKHGYVNEAKNVKALSLDPEYGIVASIEDYEYDKKTKKVKKAGKREIFSKRTVNAVVEVNKADNPSDALALSLTNTGVVNIDYIAKLMGKKPAEALKSLEGLVYRNPLTMAYETADEYLSGNVREKLEVAVWSAKGNPKAGWQANVEALKKVQPKDLIPEEISVSLGTPWIPASDIEQFTKHMLETHKPAMNIKFVPALGSWTVAWNNDWYANDAKRSVNNNSKWGTNRRDFKDILEDALNQRSPVVYDTLEDKKRVVNQKETTLAQQKVKEVQEEFKKWIWKDKERTDRLTNYYNNNFNNWRLREYDGSHLTLPGYSAVEHQLREHQKDAVWRIMQNGNTLLAHSVGAGKTWTMQTAAMEMKRLGIAKKSMFVIPNHMLAQFENEFRRIYPNAKLLVISSENLPDVTIPNAKKLSDKELKERRAEKNAARQRVLSQIATEDWDGIIISHNMFKRIPMSVEATNKFIQDQIDEMREAIIELNATNDRSANRLVKELEKKSENLKAKLVKSINEENKDIVIPFEQLGIDQIFVDEADMFKNLGFVTKMSRIAGLSNTNSQRSTDMFMKTQYITNTNGGRGVVFATGTPISNTMAEMFTMLRYLDMQGLKEKNMAFFDNWASNFAVHETTVERSPDGQGYRQTEKFTSFTNMPELIKMFRKVADVKTREDLNLKIPKLKNNKVTVVEIEPNSALSNYIKNTVAERANAIHNRSVDPSEDNMLKLTGDLRKASLDMRLVDPTIPEAVAGGKIKAVADSVFDKYQETKDTKGTQLIFCDLSTPKGNSDKVQESDEDFNENEFSAEENVTAYEEIKKRLVKKGIPANEVAFIHDAKNKNQKEELFAKVRSGEVRVLIGSTEKMGAGTNIQDKLVALHHVDAPWRPRDIEQREGRILRQGNENEEVEIFNYVTKDSFDANMWEKLKNKATMINQAMSNNLSNRIIEDMDANVLTFAEVEALASGNPLMAERTMVNAELNKYTTLRGNYIKQQAENTRKAEQIPARIKQAEIAEKQAKADIKKRVDITGDNFNLLLGKRNISKRADAKEALEATVRNYKNELGGVVGQIGGFDLRLRYVKAGSLFTRKDKTYSAQENTVIAELVGNNVYGCEPSIGSIEHAVMHEPDRVLDQAVKAQESLKKELKSLKAEIKRPFEYEDKYQQLKQRSEEIDRELNIGNDVVVEETVSDTRPYGIMKEAMTLYDEAIDKYEGIANGNEVVKQRVKESIEETLDFGTREGEIIQVDGNAEIQGRTNNANTKGEETKQNKSRVKVLGFGITRQLVNNEVFSLTGKTIRSVQDLAEYAQVLRHPGYEKYHRIYVDKNGVIIGHETVSSRMPNETSVFANDNDWWNHLRKIDNDYNIDKVYYIHNHPSTDVTPSDVDRKETRNLDSHLAKLGTHNKFGGHIVLDTTKYALIRGSGAVSYYQIPNDKQVKYDKIGVPHPALGEHLHTTAMFAKMVKNLDDNSKTTVFVLTAKNEVRAVVQLPKDINQMNSKLLSGYLERLTKRYYGRHIMLATSDDVVYKNTLELIKRGYVTSAILTKDRDVYKRKDYRDYKARIDDTFFGKSEELGNAVPKKILREDVIGLEEEPITAKSSNNLKGVVRSTEPTSFTENFTKQGVKGWLKEQGKNFYRNWIDKNDSLHELDLAMAGALGRKLDENEKVYNRAQTMNATAAGRTQALIEGNDYHIEALSKQIGRPLHKVTLKQILEFVSKDKMNKLYSTYLKDNDYNDWVDAFGHYLAFRRLREMVKYSKEVFQEEHAKWVQGGRKGKEPIYKPYQLPDNVTLQDIENAIKNAPKEFDEAAKMYYKFNDNLLTLLEDAGIISKEVHKLLNDKYKEYCPLMRDFSDTAGADMFLNGLSNGGRGIANVSSTLKRISLEGSERGVINPLETSVKSVAVMMNRAERNKVGQMAVKLAKEPGMEKVIVEIPTPKGGNAVADPKNSIFTVMIDGKKVAYQCAPELYGAIVGYNVPTAGFVLGVARSTARMLRTGATMSPSFIIRNLIRDTIFAAISSQNGFIPIVDSVRGAMALLHDPKLKAEFETAGVTSFNFYKDAESAYKSLVELNGGKELSFKHPIDLIKAIGKNFEEFSAFVESATRMGEFKRAREAGKSVEEATRAARELTLDFSRSGVLGENVNLVVPFFNATIQGGDKLYRLFRDNPVGTAVNVAKYIVLPSLVLWAINHDDEEYKELDPKVKLTHWVIGDVRIPKPQEAGVIFGSGIEALLDIASGKDPEAMKNWARQVIDGITPNILPTLILPLVEWQANYSFFRDGKLVGYREERLPDELQYKDSTSELSKGIGKLTGLSPIKIDNTVRGYTGTMGMLLWQAYDFASMDKAKLPDKKLVELPLVRDFFVNEYNTRRSVDDFYKLAEQAEKQHSGYGVKNNPTAVVKGIRQAKQQISNLNKDIRTITASGLTPAEKRERIDKKREYIKRIAQRANERYSKFYD